MSKRSRQGDLAAASDLVKFLVEGGKVSVVKPNWYRGAKKVPPSVRDMILEQGEVHEFEIPGRGHWAAHERWMSHYVESVKK